MSWNPPPAPFSEPAKKKSYWIWWVCLGMGIFSCVGFVIIAFKIQTRRFVVAAVVSIAAAAVSMAAVELDPSFNTATTDTAESTDVSDIGFGFWVVVAIWAALVVYALILLPGVRRFLDAEDAAVGARWSTTQPSAQGYYPQAAPQPRVVPPPYVPPTAPAPAQPDDSFSAVADDYLSSGPGGNAPTSSPPNAPIPEASGQRRP